MIKVNVLPSNSTHRYEVYKGEHDILYFAQTIADVAISAHNITHTFPIQRVQRICILILGVKGLNPNQMNANFNGVDYVHLDGGRRIGLNKL